MTSMILHQIDTEWIDTVLNDIEDINEKLDRLWSDADSAIDDLENIL